MISASHVYSPLSPMQTDRLGVELGRMDLVEDQLRVEALGMLLEAGHQVGALHAVGVRRPVVDVGGRRQLSALREAGDEHGLQVGARRVYCGGVTGGAGAEDQKAGVLRRHAVLALKGFEFNRTAARSFALGRFAGSRAVAFDVGAIVRHANRRPACPLARPLLAARRWCIIRHVKSVWQIHVFQ